MALLSRAIVRTLPAVPKPIVRKISERYIAGTRVEDAFRVVKRLNAESKLATIDFLGEEITGQILVAGAVIIGSVALIVRKSGEALEPGRGLRRRAIPVLEGDLQGK